MTNPFAWAGIGYRSRHAIPIRQADPPIGPAPTCQFPVREHRPGQYDFCGKKSQAGSSWCPRHYAICHRTNAQVKVDAEAKREAHAGQPDRLGFGSLPT